MASSSSLFCTIFSKCLLWRLRFLLFLNDSYLTSILLFDCLYLRLTRLLGLCLCKVALQLNSDDEWTTRFAKILTDLKDLFDNLSLLDDGKLVTNFIGWRFTVAIIVVVRLLHLLATHGVIGAIEGIQSWLCHCLGYLQSVVIVLISICMTVFLLLLSLRGCYFFLLLTHILTACHATNVCWK